MILPPSHCSSESKHIDYDKISREHERPWQCSAIIAPASGCRAHQQQRIDHGHVWCDRSNGQQQAAAHGEHKTDDFQIESRGIRTKTGTPGRKEFLHSVQVNVATAPAVPHRNLRPIFGPGHTESLKHVISVYVQPVFVNVFVIHSMLVRPDQQIVVGLWCSIDHNVHGFGHAVPNV